VLNELRVKLPQVRPSDSSEHVARNVAAYAVRAADYDAVHSEIFNHIEQQRLRVALSQAADAVVSGSLEALDFGAGSGNLTRHMIELGYGVTAADVSPAFLAIVKERFQAPTIELPDGSLDAVPDSAYDLIGVYSVLHHVPDYLGAVSALVRKLKPGGVLMLDHEHNDNYWDPTPELVAFREANANARTGRRWDPEHRRWQYLLRAAVVPSRHIARARKRLRISDEGDIHVYRDDRIDWGQILDVLQNAGAELIARVDYLAHREGYDEKLWHHYEQLCDDTTCVIARRR
jgi:SAM-dependent methyltransferase